MRQKIDRIIASVLITGFEYEVENLKQGKLDRTTIRSIARDQMRDHILSRGCIEQAVSRKLSSAIYSHFASMLQDKATGRYTLALFDRFTEEERKIAEVIFPTIFGEVIADLMMSNKSIRSRVLKRLREAHASTI